MQRKLRTASATAALVLFLVPAFLPAPASAQTAPEPPQSSGAVAPEPMPPALRFLESQGVALTYLGDEGGLRGYLGESPTGRRQVFYVSSDGTHFVAGLLFKASSVASVNVTGLQIDQMQKRFAEAQKAITGASPLATASAPSDPAKTDSAKTGSQSLMSEPPKGEPKADAGATSLVLPGMPPGAAAAQVTDALEWTTKISKASFLEDVEKVAWFSVGKDEAPVVYMIVDPQCPFCHKAWKRLEPLVLTGKLRVHIIMIAGLRGSEPLAVSILSRNEPGNAWLKGEGSADGVQIAPPPAADSKQYKNAKRYLEINHAFAEKYGVRNTPYLMYVGKDDKVYASKGLPEHKTGRAEDTTAFLSKL